MLTLLFLLLLNLTFSNRCFAQYSRNKSYRELGDGSNSVGIGMTVAGLSMTLAGFLTTPDWYYVNTTSTQVNSTNSQTKNKPFFQQGPRMLAICSGATLTITGLFTALSSRRH